jgi:hypothetical protein
LIYLNDSQRFLRSSYKFQLVDGGDNYGIRLIHPNLIDTEGQSLSTTMTDIQGNFPYLEELEGVKS